jgi:hypothetical protein
MTQHDPCRASVLAWRTGGDDNGLLGALQPLDLLIKLGDARAEHPGSTREPLAIATAREPGPSQGSCKMTKVER